MILLGEDYSQQKRPYELLRTQVLRCPEFQGIISIEHEYFILDLDGFITVKSGYRWDGPSGPAFDTDNFMEPSLFHDVLYQCLRELLFFAEIDFDQKLHNRYRKLADKMMRRLCRLNGMSRSRSTWCYYGVRWGAKKAAEPTILI